MRNQTSARRNRNPRSKRGKGTFAGLRDTVPAFSVAKSKAYTFSRMVDLSNLARAAADQGFGWSFQLNDLPGASEFTNLFDQYRILRVEFFWNLVQTQMSATTGPVWPTILAYPDYDDSAAPVTLTEVEQYQQTERLQFSNSRSEFSRSLTPSVNMSVLSVGPAGVFAVGKRSPWLDCASSQVEHFGLKFWVKNYNTAVPNGLISIMARYHFQCRNPR